VTWLKVDDKFHGHPKVLSAGTPVLGLWVRAASWAAAYETDGLVPTDVMRGFGRPRDAAALVEAGLWVPCASGFWLHDFLKYNPSKEQLEAERAKARRRRETARRDQPELFG